MAKKRPGWKPTSGFAQRPQDINKRGYGGGKGAMPKKLMSHKDLRTLIQDIFQEVVIDRTSGVDADGKTLITLDQKTKLRKFVEGMIDSSNPSDRALILHHAFGLPPVKTEVSGEIVIKVEYDAQPAAAEPQPPSLVNDRVERPSLPAPVVIDGVVLRRADEEIDDFAELDDGS